MLSFSCAICLDEWPDAEALRSLLCGHVFCGSCIQSLLALSRPLCPSCRAGPIYPRDIRPIYINVEPRITTPRGPSSRKPPPTISPEILPKLHQLSADLQSLASNSDTDVQGVVDGFLGLLASERCNEPVKDALLSVLATFLKTSLSSTYEMARSMMKYRTMAHAYRREKRPLERDLATLRTDKRALAQHNDDLGEQLTAAREELARANEGLLRARNEQCRSNITYERWMQLASESSDNREELGRARLELQHLRQRAHANGAKYRDLCVQMNGIINNMACSSQPLGGPGWFWSGPTSWYSDKGLRLY
ncbi:hypothetical protein PENSPDRAFT_734755 [Peniophora sp. CONT]|nr:hypothetical protein PENSPDRAFT_734755 [Peniophora sp. CONT]